MELPSRLIPEDKPLTETEYDRVMANISPQSLAIAKRLEIPMRDLVLMSRIYGSYRRPATNNQLSARA